METTGKYSSSIIANWFYSQDNIMKDDIMKVLKLVYISHGFHLALTENPLIKEDVQAWQYGPVIPELYFQLKADRFIIDPSEKEMFDDDNQTKKLLEIIYRKYGSLNGIQLSNLTHKKNSPWDITVNKFKSKIENDLIKEHYKELLSNG